MKKTQDTVGCVNLCLLNTYSVHKSKFTPELKKTFEKVGKEGDKIIIRFKEELIREEFPNYPSKKYQYY